MKLMPGKLPQGAGCNQVYEPGIDPDPEAFISEYEILCKKHRLKLFVGSDDELHIGLLSEGETVRVPDEEPGVAFYYAGEVYHEEYYRKLQNADKT
jgi:hypothetical protein